VTEYGFTLRFGLAAVETGPDALVEMLGEQGCDDALVGIGVNGRIALRFIRESDSAHHAVFGALADVKRAIPDVVLIEATPDLVGLTDVAEIVGCTRQNMRQLMLSSEPATPAPVHEGRPSIWHLAHVLAWLRREKHYRIGDDLMDLAETNMQLNVAVDLLNADPSAQREIDSLLA